MYSCTPRILELNKIEHRRENNGYTPKRLSFFKKNFSSFCLKQRKNKEKTKKKQRKNKEKTKKKQRKNKQKIIIIYLTNIAPSGLKYPN